MRILILMGGSSAEHSVSLRSAAAVTAAVHELGHEVAHIGISPHGRWRSDDFSDLLSQADSRLLEISEEGGREVVLAHSGGGLLLAVDGGGFEKDSGRFDLVFPVLHGPGGEDGSVQGMLESLGLPFVGAGSRASAIAMDKLTMKTLAAGAGLPQTDFFEASGLDSEETSACVEKSFGFPCFLKPSGLGSSVGITKVETASGIEAALAEARRYDRRVIVERAVAGRELEMALLGGASPETSPLGEIATATGFYDFKSKYVDTGAALIVPAEVGDNVRSEADALAARVWQLIGCHGMARVDFFLQNDGRLLFNEVNTIPGFTAISMFPRCWQAAGLSMAALVGRLLAGAAERPD